jgi:hypothetical protein
MAGQPPDDISIGALISRLIDDAERFVRAELRLYRAQLFQRIEEGRTAILLIAAAFLLAQSAIIGMVVGLVLILRRPLGAVWATITVGAGTLIVAALLLRIAVAKIRKLTEIKDKPE